MARFSLRQQIEEVDHELDQRASVYPRMVAKRKLGESAAQYHVDRMKAVRRSLSWLNDNLDTIRQRCPELFGKEG